MSTVHRHNFADRIRAEAIHWLCRDYAVPSVECTIHTVQPCVCQAVSIDMIAYFLGLGNMKVSPTYLLCWQLANLRTHFYLELPMGIPIIVEERFDTFSLARQIKNIGRAYQRQAIELVNIYRMFMETFPPEKRQNAMPKL